MEYGYDSGFYPPAPVLNVDISDPLQRRKEQGIKCQLDTGADISILHNSIISSLELPLIDVTSVEDYQGNITEEQEVYLAKIFFCNREFEVEIIGTPEGEGLIGRDI